MVVTEGERIAVFGATGQQGGAVVDALLKIGKWPVRGITRNPDSEKALMLRSKEVEVVRGDLNDPESVSAALTGVQGVFSIQVVTEENGASTERRQAIGVVDTAKRLGIKHLVYGSSADIGKRPFPGGTDVKAEVETYLRSSGVPFTITRPSSFMENFNRSRGAIEAGTLPQAFAPSGHQDLVAVADIGQAAAAAFDRPNDFVGQSVELAGDRLSQQEIIDTFSRVLGRPVRSVAVDRERMPAPYRALLDWLEENDGHRVDHPDAIRHRWGLSLIRLDEWIRIQGWKTAEGIAAS